MPKFLNASFGLEGFPRELLGLQSWTTFTPQMIGFGGHFYDAAFVRATTFGSGGYYVIVGGQNNVSNYILISSGGGITKYDSTTVGGANQFHPLMGVCSTASGAQGTSDEVIMVGVGNSLSLYAQGMQAVYQIADSSQLGSWGNWAGSFPLVSKCEAVAGGAKIIGFGLNSIGGRLFSNKPVGLASTTDWDFRTVPAGNLSGGYVKGRVAPGGYVACMTSAGTGLDVSSGGGDYGDAGMRTDTTTTQQVVDFDYGVGAAQWIKIDASLVWTAPRTWAPGGNPTWTQRFLPINIEGMGGTDAINCFALDVPNPALGGTDQDRTHGSTTWYGIVIGTSENTPPLFTGVLLTKDFVNYITVEIPGVCYSTTQVFFGVDGNTYFKYVGNRLFVFNAYGCNMSGPLGINELLT